MITPVKSIVPKQALVAVSMGVDSVAAYLYFRYKGFDFVPIHFNHKLRHQNDLMEQSFKILVDETSNRAAPLIGHGNELKTEFDCREARINYFRQVADQTGIRTIITAHHMDDYIESYLMNCFRGNPEYTPIPLVTNFGDITIVHPFLLTEKADFVTFLDRYKAGRYNRLVVEDETNKVIKGSRRNWIRNVITPAMVDQQISLKKWAKTSVQQQIEQLQ